VRSVAFRKVEPTSEKEQTMNISKPVARRIFVAILAASALSVALPQPGFAQADPRLGTWKLDLAKSAFTQGPAPKSRTVTFAKATATSVSIDAQGKTTTMVTMRNYDGRPHPTTGSPNFDASALTRIGGNNFILSRLKGGRLVQVQTNLLSQNGKTFTVSSSGVDAAGKPMVSVAVYEKQ
jgi:hypothetical protein